jgi:pre-rRNA-processing protein TSR3
VAFLPTVIIRHRKENLKKCSLHGLEHLSYLCFITYPLCHDLPKLDSYVLLDVDGDPLSESDAKSGLLLIDSTWRLADKIKKTLPDALTLPRRALPKKFRTAYPRRQDDCSDPQSGLASVEALYIAHRMLTRSYDELLDRYYWRDQFLQKNYQKLT